MRKLLNAFCFLLVLVSSSAWAATYYIDYENGVDTNAGTTASPWKTVPGMANQGAHRGASPSGYPTTTYNHSAGDVFVLKGGVTWPAASLPLYIGNSGGVGSPDVYMGGQQCSWVGSYATRCDGINSPCGTESSVSCNSGSKWEKTAGAGYPIFDGEYASTGGADLYVPGVIHDYYTAKSHLIFDGLKIIRVGDTSDAKGQPFWIGGQDIEIKNMWLEPNSVNAIEFQCTGGGSKYYFHDNYAIKYGRIDISCGDETFDDLRVYNNILPVQQWDNTAFHTDGVMVGSDNLPSIACQSAGVPKACCTGFETGTCTYQHTNLRIYGNKWYGDWSKSATAQIFLNGTSYNCYPYTSGSHAVTVGQVIAGSVTGDYGNCTGSGTPYACCIAAYNADTCNDAACAGPTCGNGNKIYIISNSGGWTGSGTGHICVSGALQSGENILTDDSNNTFCGTVSSTGTASANFSFKDVYIYNNVLVTENDVTDNNYPSLSPGIIVSMSGVHDSVYIYNNTLDSGSHTTPTVNHCIFLVDTTNSVVKGNILRGCDNGVSFDGSWSNATVTDNIYNVYARLVVDWKGANAYFTCGTIPESFGTGYCSVADAAIKQSPSGGVTGSGDWHLTVNSPAIGNGVDLSTIFTTDHDGVSRGSSWDIGAYQYAAGGTTYTITTSPGTHCSSMSCSPNPVYSGSTSTCTHTPASGYSTTGISGCGGSWSSGNTMVTAAMSADCTVSSTCADTTAPTITAFTIPSTSTSLTVLITTLTATDAVGVTGYLVNESATPPVAGSGNWQASAAYWTTTTGYVFGSQGGKTLYAWAKDAAGNISAVYAGRSITISPSHAVPWRQ